MMADIEITETLIEYAAVGRRPLYAISIPTMEDVASPDFIALDFETANAGRDSPCAIGLAWIQEGEVVGAAHQLIRPYDNFFDPFNVSIHGISAKDVEDEPEFPEIWETLLPHFEGGATLVAHNASFDFSVLRAVLHAYDLPWPECRHLCSVKIAKAVWPGRQSYSLPDIASLLGIALKHHNAMSDAQAAAEIVSRAMEKTAASSLDHLVATLGISIGRIAPDFYEPCRSPPVAPSSTMLEAAKLARGTEITNKRVVFTGTLQTMQRSVAGVLAETAGAIWQPNVKKDTDYLVVGAEPGGGKIAKALTHGAKYGRPEMIDEMEFLRLIGMGY